MEDLIALIQANIDYAPWIIFAALLLAGFNIPVSEDGMIFISALLASNHPGTRLPFFLGVYAGAYFSDVICYWLGRLLGPKLFRIRLFANMASPEKIEKVAYYFERYGVLTLIVGRFIPFGVRNAMFLTAGLSKMNFIKFALADWLACSISVMTYFYLYYQYGEAVIDTVKEANIIIFSVAFIGVVGYLIYRRHQKA
ncbi:MAG TPA: DedA family protein [Crenotrichaceae bacterium]|nr:DedA family protein [Crenotrichaceae bacterium]